VLVDHFLEERLRLTWTRSLTVNDVVIAESCSTSEAGNTPAILPGCCLPSVCQHVLQTIASYLSNWPGFESIGLMNIQFAYQNEKVL